MQRIQLIAAALCLIVLLTVGAGAVAAQQENPRQAGASHIYFCDVAPNDTHGKGKLQINTDKHTFEFNGQGFTPSAMIELKAKVAGDTDYKVFASGKTTPSGNLHIAGTWDKDAVPVAASLDYYPISGFELDNAGWFVAQLACKYSTDGGATWKETSPIKGITKGQSARMDWLIDYGVPDHAWVRIHAIVVGGKDRTGDIWQYEDHLGSSWGYHVTTQLADYKISGTTGNPTLDFIFLSA